MSANRKAAERGLVAGRTGDEWNPYRRPDRRDLWERGRINGTAGGCARGAIAPHAPSPCQRNKLAGQCACIGARL